MKLDPTIEMLIVDAIRNRMYGSIELKFESGRMVLAKRTETIKPSSRDSRDEVHER